MKDRQGMRALLISVALLFVLAGGMGWLAIRGLTRGVTTLPMPRYTQRRPVARETEPAMYWFAVALYAVVGSGALVLGALGVREGRRLR